MMTTDEFEVKRNQLTEEIRQLEAEIRDRQQKIQTLTAARDIFNERQGRPREHVQVDDKSAKPRGAISDSIRVYIGSHDKYTTTDVVDYLVVQFPDHPRRDLYGTVYTYLKRHPDPKWVQEEARP
jgi:hypothetical protein